tara:strand:- start:138 stop:563 length:426 start_codon:yes stop_codon:yes gene_type:complete
MPYVNEAALQKNVVAWLNYALPKGSIFHHSPSEGAGNKVQYYVKQKTLGFKSGWPDLEIFVPGCKVIFIELKQPKNYPTPRQRAIHEILNNTGALCFVARSIKEVYDGIKDTVEVSKHPYVKAMVNSEETIRGGKAQRRST